MSNAIPRIQFTIYLLLDTSQIPQESTIPLAENGDRGNGDERKQRELPAY
jgi:hypothetical protein